MVTARDTLDNRLTGFDAGADDYLRRGRHARAARGRPDAGHGHAGTGTRRPATAPAAVAVATADAADARQPVGRSPCAAGRGLVARLAARQRQPAHAYPPDPPRGRQTLWHGALAHRARHRLSAPGA
ncbi:hypothetical protein G6F50_015974 [Rhizopus delemar]|uniref:Uncharacterized protein n=1 Tax=Rhizopus delemar TaxID=936053 RepID=A0A9P6XVM0_9FUNG|nr:hypothetical protein G6F50_015974 [Rhizopus delemar]